MAKRIEIAWVTPVGGRGLGHRLGLAALVALAMMATSAPSWAGITESQVLVVYNGPAFQAPELKNYYLAAHPGIPAANVFNLNSSAPQLGTSDMSYSDFVTLLRNPIRNYFSQPGAPSPSSIIAICLIRPIPHRIYDTNSAASGDTPGSNPQNPPPGTALYEVEHGDATYASVDSELALLWQNLNTGEAGGFMDSYSDDFIVNPYHQSSSSISGPTRANIQVQKIFTPDTCLGGGISWLLGGSGSTRLTPGDMYLVCRVDGLSLADAEAEIDRAKNLYVNKATVKILLDEYDNTTASCPNLDDDGLCTNDSSDPFWGGNDYEQTRDNLSSPPAGWNVRYDNTFSFIDHTQETGPLIGYASYGENDSNGGCGEDPSGNGTYIQGFQFPPGAIFNTIESFNARDFNGLGRHPSIPQEQISDFIASGGTFGVGNVWEPFTFSVPDNAFLMVNMLNNGLTFAEAAYASFPALSWAQIAVGDPLGKMTIINDPGTPRGDMDGDGNVDGRDIPWFVDVLLHGTARYRATFPTKDPIARGDFDGDLKVTLSDLPPFINVLLNGLP